VLGPLASKQNKLILNLAKNEYLYIKANLKTGDRVIQKKNVIWNYHGCGVTSIVTLLCVSSPFRGVTRH
jgi:hypothetical protein